MHYTGMANMSETSQTIPTPDEALPGRPEPMSVNSTHYVNTNTIMAPFPDNMQTCLLGMGCFWGAERKYWLTPGVFSTAVGYTSGHTENPNYREVCSGKTGHTEVVLVVFDPNEISFESILQIFWENHDPTQGMRQGNDAGTQYRSGIYVNDSAQLDAAEQSLSHYQHRIDNENHNIITTEIKMKSMFYYAEEDHQQYLAKNPNGYCSIGGIGISYSK